MQERIKKALRDGFIIHLIIMKKNNTYVKYTVMEDQILEETVTMEQALHTHFGSSLVSIDAAEYYIEADSISDVIDFITDYFSSSSYLDDETIDNKTYILLA